MGGACGREETSGPDRAQKRRSQINAGELLPEFDHGGVSGADSGICKLAQQSSMNCALLVRMDSSVRQNLDCRFPHADAYQFDAQKRGNGGWIPQMRAVPRNVEMAVGYRKCVRSPGSRRPSIWRRK